MASFLSSALASRLRLWSHAVTLSFPSSAGRDPDQLTKLNPNWIETDRIVPSDKQTNRRKNATDYNMPSISYWRGIYTHVLFSSSLSYVDAVWGRGRNSIRALVCATPWFTLFTRDALLVLYNHNVWRHWEDLQAYVKQGLTSHSYSKTSWFETPYLTFFLPLLIRAFWKSRLKKAGRSSRDGVCVTAGYGRLFY